MEPVAPVGSSLAVRVFQWWQGLLCGRTHFSETDLVALPRLHRPTLDQEIFVLKKLTGGVVEQYRRGKGFRFLFVAQPSPIGREYRVLIDRKEATSRVYVLEPDLNALANGRKIPHIYSTIVDERNPSAVCLCLYHPNRNERSAGMLIADTLVPWAILWLFFFENWIATDVWDGGGEHPS